MSSKIDTLDPLIKGKIEALIAAADAATEYKWIVTAARRTMAEQSAIYAKGRTAPGSIVSNAKPGSSAHNYGLAADLAPTKGGKICWSATESVWKAMADAAVKLGLTAGFYFKTFKDMPHVELPVWKERRALWQAGKLEVQ